MAILQVSIQRERNPNFQKGTISIRVKATGAILNSYIENFPSETSDDYILDVLLERTKKMMRELALRQIPQNLSFDVDSDQMRLRKIFDL